MKQHKSQSVRRWVSIAVAVLVGVFLGMLMTAVLAVIFWRYL